MAQTEKHRDCGLDLIKTIAMICVVALHTTHAETDTGMDINHILYYTGVIAIPLFFTVSGWLMLGKENVTYRYVAHKIWGIVRFVFIFCLCFWLIHS